MRQKYVICVKKFKMSDRDCPDVAYHKVYTLLLNLLLKPILYYTVSN